MIWPFGIIWCFGSKYRNIQKPVYAFLCEVRGLSKGSSIGSKCLWYLIWLCMNLALHIMVSFGHIVFLRLWHWLTRWTKCVAPVSQLLLDTVMHKTSGKIYIPGSIKSNKLYICLKPWFLSMNCQLPQEAKTIDLHLATSLEKSIYLGNSLWFRAWCHCDFWVLFHGLLGTTRCSFASTCTGNGALFLWPHHWVHF